MKSLAVLALLGSTVSAAAGPWAQCGGQNWSGDKTCAAGWTCTYSNPWYSQCLQSTGQNPPAAPKPSTTSSAKPATSVIPSKPATSTTPSNGGVSGKTFKTSVTHYGAGDTFGSPNCNTNTAACFFYTKPGFSAAVSQNLYGAGPGQGQGPGCGTCWRITGQTDSSGKALSNAGTSIVVMINNLCPADGNPLCSQNGLSGTNQYGANVNFDLCSDSGASAAFFGNSGVGLAIGTATEVDCSQWSGSIVH